LGSLSQTYDGTAKSAAATTGPAGLTVDFTYDGSATAPTAAGSYTVVGTVNDANYQGSAINTLVIGKASPAVTTWPTATAITYGQTLAASTLNGGAASVIGSFAFTTPSTAPGAGTASQSVTFTPTDTANYNPVSGSGSVTVGKATATVTLGSLSQTYDGTAKSATATTDPASLTVDFTYAGSATAPTAAGSYVVVGRVNDANYQGSASGNLEITPASSATAISSSLNPSAAGSNVTFSATVGLVTPATTTPTGNVQFLTNGMAMGSPVPLAGGMATLSTGILPPGTNTVTANYLGEANYLGSSDSLSQVVAAIVEPPSVVGIIAHGDGSVTVAFAGTPGAEYFVLATTNLASAGSWVNVSTNTAGPAGQWIYTDNAITSYTQRFFRAAKP
jgi:hypothetical protein